MYDVFVRMPGVIEEFVTSLVHNTMEICLYKYFFEALNLVTK